MVTLSCLEGKASNKQSARPLVLPMYIIVIPMLSLGNNYMQFFYFAVGLHDTMSLPHHQSASIFLSLPVIWRTGGTSLCENNNSNKPLLSFPLKSYLQSCSRQIIASFPLHYITRLQAINILKNIFLMNGESTHICPYISSLQDEEGSVKSTQLPCMLCAFLPIVDPKPLTVLFTLPDFFLPRNDNNNFMNYFKLKRE